MPSAALLAEREATWFALRTGGAWAEGSSARDPETKWDGGASAQLGVLLRTGAGAELLALRDLQLSQVE